MKKKIKKNKNDDLQGVPNSRTEPRLPGGEQKSSHVRKIFGER